MSLRVLTVAACPFPARRGTPVRIERIAQHLALSGHRVDVATYGIGGPETAPGIQVHRISRFQEGTIKPGPNFKKLIQYDPALARLMRRMLRAEHYDVIHAHHVEGLLTAAFARIGLDVPLVFDMHTMLGSELPSYQSGFLKSITARLGWKMDGWLPGLADHMIAVTGDIRNKLMTSHQLSGSRVTVAMNGVEAEIFKNHDHYENGFSQLIYTGTLAPYQGIDSMLEAFALALQSESNLRLNIVSGDSFQQYEEMAETLGIRPFINLFDDRFEDLPARLAASGTALMPRADCDGIPQKLLNYFAAGRPIIAFEGSAKIAFHNRAGLVVPNGDISGFASAIVELSQQPRKACEMGRFGRSLAQSTFNWSNTAELCVEAFGKAGARSSKTEFVEKPVKVPKAAIPEAPGRQDPA